MYHFVWIPKYWHKVFSDPYREVLKAIIHKIVFDYDIDIVELEIAGLLMTLLNGRISAYIWSCKSDRKGMTRGLYRKSLWWSVQPLPAGRLLFFYCLRSCLFYLTLVFFGLSSSVSIDSTISLILKFPKISLALSVIILCFSR